MLALARNARASVSLVASLVEESLEELLATLTPFPERAAVEIPERPLLVYAP